MTTTPPDLDMDQGLITSLQDVFQEYSEGVLYLLGVDGKPLSAKTPANFRIKGGDLEVLEPVEMVALDTGLVRYIIAEADGQEWRGHSGCPCGLGHPVPVFKDSTVTVVAGIFRCV